MSNFKNAFGNEGWIQSSIDRSRGKTRPGEKRRKAAAYDAARRKETLENDPLYKKYGSSASTPPLGSSAKQNNSPFVRMVKGIMG